MIDKQADGICLQKKDKIINRTDKNQQIPLEYKIPNKMENKDANAKITP